MSGTLLRNLKAVASTATGAIAVGIVAMIILLAIGQDLLPLRPYAEIDLSNTFIRPSSEYPLGTDNLGRSILSGIVEGTRIVLYVAAVTVGVSAVFGYVLGMISGYAGGAVDQLIMRVTDILLSFPPIFLALAIISVVGSGLRNAVIAMIIAQIAPFARLMRGQVLAAKESPYVETAHAAGARGWRIMWQHILPNISGPLVVQATFATGTSILGVAALGFLGLGAQPPTPDWGTMVFETQLYLTRAPHAVVIPGLAIFFVVAALNVLGESLREVTDERSGFAYRIW